jgi:hypothetical protein
MNRLKTRDELHEMTLEQLNDYEHQLYLLWQQTCKIKTYRKMMYENQILLNSTDVVDVKLLPEGDEEE